MSSNEISKNDIYFYNIWPISKLCTPPCHHQKWGHSSRHPSLPSQRQAAILTIRRRCKKVSVIVNFPNLSIFHRSVSSFVPFLGPPWFHLSPLGRNQPWRMLTRFIDIHIFIYSTTLATLLNQVIDWNSLRAPELICACGHVDNLGETLQTWVLMTKTQKVKEVFSKEAPYNVLRTCLGNLLQPRKSFYILCMYRKLDGFHQLSD